MKEYESLSHTRWDCKYRVMFIPKRRKRKIFEGLRRHLGVIFHERAAHEEATDRERHLMLDHVHMCLIVPPKYAVSNVVGYLKGKSAILIAPVWRLGATSPAKCSRRGGILSRRSVWMRRW